MPPRSAAPTDPARRPTTPGSAGAPGSLEAGSDGATGREGCRATMLLMAAALILVTNSALSPALPALEFLFTGADGAELKTRLLITAPSVAAAITAPIAGFVADRFGRRRQLLAGILLFAVAGSAGLYLPSLDAILASRCLLGVGVAMIFTSQIALLGDYFIGGDRTRQLGYQFGGASIAAAVVLVLAGLLTAISPRLVFIVYLLPLALLPLMREGLVEVGPDRLADADPAARIRGTGWSVAVVLIGITLGAGMAVAYLLPTELPFVVDASGQLHPIRSGLVLAIGMAIAGLIGTRAGALRTRLGAGGALAVGIGLMAAGFGLLATFDGMIVMTIGVGAVFGGFTIVVVHLDAFALDLTPPSSRGLAMGIVNTALFLGQAATPIVFGPLIDAQGLDWVFGLAAAVSAVAGVVVAIGLRGLERPGTPPTPLR